MADWKMRVMRVVGPALSENDRLFSAAVGPRVRVSDFYSTWAYTSWSSTQVSDTRPAQARCAYCGRYGTLGRCEGCGANNEPFRLE